MNVALSVPGGTNFCCAAVVCFDPALEGGGHCHVLDYPSILSMNIMLKPAIHMMDVSPV